MPSEFQILTTDSLQPKAEGLITSPRGDVSFPKLESPATPETTSSQPVFRFNVEDITDQQPLNFSLIQRVESGLVGKTQPTESPPSLAELLNPQLPEYEKAKRAILDGTRGLDRGAIVLAQFIPLENNLVMIMKEQDKEAMRKLLRQEASLTKVETSGRIRLSKLSKPLEYQNRWVKSREIEKLEFTGEGDPLSVMLLNEGYAPGEIDFHVHLIDPKERPDKDDHITVADIRAIAESAAWFDPDSQKGLNPNYRVHCIISLMTEKKLLRTHGRAVFTFYIMDLTSDSAQKGHPPYGLKKVPRTVFVDF